MFRMVTYRIKKLIAWAIAIFVVLLMASGAWWLLGMV